MADKLNWSYVNAEWKKATERIVTDPSAAVTTSRALLETVCMHILEARRLEYIWDGDLPKLYRTAASVLNIYPDKQQEDTFKRLLGACTTIINSVAALRNVLGDAHGHGMNVKEAEQRHARLAVNAASTLALFLMETHLAYAE